MNIAIVGCGAVTRLAHLHVSQLVDGAAVTTLIDINLTRAQELASTFNVPNVFANYDRLGDVADAAIVAVPHALHVSVGESLLNQGLHVLIEKPMAVTAEECDRLITAAERNGRVLAVGLMRRFAPWCRLVKTALDTELLGVVQSFEWREGSKFSWPTASDAPFRKEFGGGVLIDTGAHALDTLLWWFGPVGRFEYFDDQEGGVEADCEMNLRFQSRVEGRVVLSRTRDLGFRVMIRGSKAALELEPYRLQTRLRVGDQVIRGCTTSYDNPIEDGNYHTTMVASLQDWVDAIRFRRPPTVTGAEARRSVELIEKCYRSRQPLQFPWLTEGLPRRVESEELS